MTFSLAEDGQGVRVVFDGRLGLDETDHLGRVVGEAPSTAPVSFDFSSVRVFEDAAIPRLAVVARRLGPRLSVRGLTSHHRRLLRHFGCDAPWTSIEPSA